MDLYSSVIAEDKIDFTKKFPDLYDAVDGEVAEVTIPALKFITSEWMWIESTGDEYDNAFNDVHTYMRWIAFSMKFRLKRNEDPNFEDYHMPPIEAKRKIKGDEKKDRKWKLMLLQPNSISEGLLRKTVEIAKMKQQETVLPAVELEKVNQGTCIQTLHCGSYTEVNTSIKLLEQYAKDNGYKITGDHHEIYLNDKRRTKSEKLQTIVRYQVKK